MSYKPDFYSRTYNKFTSPEGFTHYHFKWPIGKLPTTRGAGHLQYGTYGEDGSTRFAAMAAASNFRNSHSLQISIREKGDSTPSNIYVGRAMLSSESTGCKLYGKSKTNRFADLHRANDMHSLLLFRLYISEDELKQAADDYVIHYWVDIFNGDYEKPPERQFPTPRYKPVPTPAINGRELFSLDMSTCYFDGVKSQFDEDPSSFSDVVLVTKRAADDVERRFYCHRNILAARSPVFKTMLTNQGFEESRTRLVDIEDVSSECMGNVLQYMYTGVLSFDCDDQSMHSFKDRVLEVLFAAEKYALPELVDLCAKHTVSFVDDVDRLEVLRVAELHDLDWLKRFCIMALSTNMTIFKEEGCRGKISDEGLAELGKMCAERVVKTKVIQVTSLRLM